jgi:hypothetical protein
MDRETIYQRLSKIGAYYIALVYVTIIISSFSPIVFKYYHDEERFWIILILSVPLTSAFLVALDYFKNRQFRYWPQSVMVGIAVMILSLIFTFIVGVFFESSKYRETNLYQHKYYSDQKIMIEEDYSNHETALVKVADFTPWFQIIQKIDTTKINMKRWVKLD